MEAKFGPGKYFLGDIFLVMKKEIYENFWGKKHSYEEGQWSLADDTTGAEESFVVGKTYWGEGDYEDNREHPATYQCDTGVIGVVPVSMWETQMIGEIQKKNGLGDVLNIKKELVFRVKRAGVFEITADVTVFIIDTYNDCSYDEDEDEDYDDEEEEDEDEDEDY